jgi:hypothetical protein
MLHNELSLLIAQEKQREWIAAAQHRAAAAACGPRPGLSRRMARPIGRLLVRTGAGLLRYGRAGSGPATQPYRASARSIELN